jgi:hypothetical protein
MCRINRRQFAIGGLSAAAGGPFLLTGCASAVPMLIPVFLELTLSEILAVIGKATFELYGPGKTSYSAAEYWRGKPSNWQDFAARKIVEFFREIEAKFMEQRKLILDTPIISCTEDRNILMQAGPKGRWSLVTGGRNGDEVFGVSNGYLSWWIERGRNHALTFDGHTSGPEPGGSGLSPTAAPDRSYFCHWSRSRSGFTGNSRTLKS